MVTKKRVAQGNPIVCEVCGLSVAVDEVGEIAVKEESTLLHRGKPMKKKDRKATVNKNWKADRHIFLVITLFRRRIIPAPRVVSSSSSA